MDTATRDGSEPGAAAGRRQSGPDSFTPTAFRREVVVEAFRDAFLRGRGAPLLFLWVAGGGLFLVVWPSPSYAALWTGLVLVFAVLTARDALHDQAGRR